MHFCVCLKTILQLVLFYLPHLKNKYCIFTFFKKTKSVKGNWSLFTQHDTVFAKIKGFYFLKNMQFLWSVGWTKSQEKDQQPDSILTCTVTEGKAVCGKAWSVLHKQSLSTSLAHMFECLQQMTNYISKPTRGD